MSDSSTVETTFLKNLWDDREAARLESQPLELLRYRSNLLGADLRITNFGGGNTSSKFDLPDPLTGEPTRVMAVKGSGGDLRSIGTSGFAVLYLDKLESADQALSRRSVRGRDGGLLPAVARSARTGSRPRSTRRSTRSCRFRHVDHLHPDWAIALAASANGKARLEEFNQKYGRKIVWVPWQRPGFELALMLRKAVEDNPGCDGIILGGHGLFTWGETQRECYLSSIKTIDQMGEFVQEHAKTGRPAAVRRRRRRRPLPIASRSSARCCRILRGAVSSNRRVIAPLRQQRGCARVRQLAVGGAAVPDGHQLSRSLPAHPHLAAVRRRGSRKTGSPS